MKADFFARPWVHVMKLAPQVPRLALSDWVGRHNEAYPLPPVGIMGRSEWTVKE